MGLYNLVEKDGAEEAVWGTTESAGNRGEHQAHLVSGETSADAGGQAEARRGRAGSQVGRRDERSG